MLLHFGVEASLKEYTSPDGDEGRYTLELNSRSSAFITFK
jgi:hypothetical protein